MTWTLRTRHTAGAAAEVVLPKMSTLPTGNVRLVSVPVETERAPVDPAAAARTEAGAAAARRKQPRRIAATTKCNWVIRDGRGNVVDRLTGVRSLAVRQMSVVAMHGAELPLALYGPDGHPTGDRLPS